MSELLIARNPLPDSRLPYLLRLPLGQGKVFRVGGTWPRTSAIFCYPVSLAEWPADAEIIDRVPLRSCVQRGASIDVIADRSRETRSQIVYTKARGRDAVFWQAPRTRKQARPNVAVPTARAAGFADLQIAVDAHEKYPYTFSGQQVTVSRRALPCGDYGLLADGRLIASVERKTLADFASSVTSGKLRFALGELAALPRAAVVIEDRYSGVFKLDVVRPTMILEALAELQVRYPTVPIVFCENRKLAQEWTFRFLGAARAWAETEVGMQERDDVPPGAGILPPAAPEPDTAEVRRWAKANDVEVPNRGRLKPSVWLAYQRANSTSEPSSDRR